MTRKLIVVSVLPSLVALIATVAVAVADSRPKAAEAMPMLVSPAWLAAHLKDPELVLLHVGDDKSYKKQHIPGARPVTFDDISVSAKPNQGLMLELPPAEQLRRGLETLGISNDSRVVVYFGEDWVSPSTRVVLTLDAAGLGARTALLDGGMAAWTREGHPVTEAVPPAKKGKLAALAIRPIIVDATTVVASLGKPGFAVVDARNKEFYDGTKTGGSHESKHKTGHIAGALSLPFDSVWNDDNTLRSTDELTALFSKAGVKPGDTVIGYCHIGQQATAMLFAARKLGHPVLLYDGSFEDWSLFHPGYPVAKAEGKP